MKHSLWDFTWSQPSQPQIDALTWAKKHPYHLPPEEVALFIFTAKESEWLRNVKWIVTHPDKIGWPEQLQEEITKVLREIVIITEVEWWQQGGWWPMRHIPATRMYIRDGLARFMPVFECIPAHFNMFTMQGLRIVQLLLSEEVK